VDATDEAPAGTAAAAAAAANAGGGDEQRSAGDAAPPRWLRFRVTDTGIGVAQGARRDTALHALFACER
jgi:hypothetical protein